MSETIDINRQTWTKRGGVVTGLHHIEKGTHFNHRYPLRGVENFNGSEVIRDWALNGAFSLLGYDDEIDLTHTPPVPQPASPKPAYELLYRLTPGNGDIVIGQHTIEVAHVEGNEVSLRITYGGEYTK